jgi:hypothetical protein
MGLIHIHIHIHIHITIHIHIHIHRCGSSTPYKDSTCSARYEPV